MNEGILYWLYLPLLFFVGSGRRGCPFQKLDHCLGVISVLVFRRDGVFGAPRGNHVLLEDAFLSCLHIGHFEADELLVVVFLIHRVQTELQILILARSNAADEVADVGWLLSVEGFEDEPLLIVKANIDLVGQNA